MIGDASLWVSYFLPADRFHADSVTWIEDRLRAGERLTAPTLLLPEVAGAIARRSQRTDLGLEAARQLWAWPGLVIVPVDEPVMLLAHQLAAGLLLKG
ncbi:MAG: hypothetical protein HY331_04080, partial [Chloroflexi bacterium]|nr:hypothetical protein [Chloroflexota bacterium]